MSWEKIEDHLFNKYDVEGEDKELSELMEEHDKEVKAKAIDEFAKEIRDWQIDIQDNEYDADKFDFVFERIFEIAEEMKAGGIDG